MRAFFRLSLALMLGALLSLVGCNAATPTPTMVAQT